MVYFEVSALDTTICTTVTSHGHVVCDWINTILNIHCHHNFLIVGLDVKWCPRRRYGTRGVNPIASLQLCIGHNCLVFRLIHCDDIPDILRQFLVDDRILFVGVRIRNTAERLWNDYQLSLQHVQDLGETAASTMGMQEMTDFGVRRLGWEVAGLRTENPCCVLSNWADRRLSWMQIGSAAVDAYLSSVVGWELYNRWIRNGGAMVYY